MPKQEVKLKRLWGSNREILLTENVLIHLPRKNKILDVGCGDGYLSYLLTKRGSDVVGIDISPFRIKYAHEKCSGADFILADGRHLPFRGESFDSVVCCEVFEHVLDYPLIIDEIYRVSKKKARLLATVPYRYHGHIHSFNEQKIYNGLKGGGYTVNKIYGIGFELEGIGKRFPSTLRIFIHKVFYVLFKRANFLFAVGYKS